MTVQFINLKLKPSEPGWEIANPDSYNGGHGIELRDAADTHTVKTISLSEHLPHFNRFAHITTAGMAWLDLHLAYFIELDEINYFVVRAWWGARIVLNLNQQTVITADSRLAEEIKTKENALVLDQLDKVIAISDNENYSQYFRASPQVGLTLHSLLFLPGVLGLNEALPHLRYLEERLQGRGIVRHSDLRYEPNQGRLLAQISLRRLGERPIGYPVITFKAAPWPQEPVRPVEGHDRHRALAQIGPGTPLIDLYDHLGPPDYINRAPGKTDFWRYDIDVEPPYTLLVWLNGAKDAVERLVKYDPPFWQGPEVFQANGRSLLGPYSDTLYASTDQLEDGSFVGKRTEINSWFGP